MTRKLMVRKSFTFVDSALGSCLGPSYSFRVAEGLLRHAADFMEELSDLDFQMSVAFLNAAQDKRFAA